MISLFRNSAPYINAHRGKTFVIMLSGEAIASDTLPTIIHDIALLNSLGVRLVIVHGARPQIEQRVQWRDFASRYHDDVRITDKATLACVQDAAGSVRSQIEALLTMGLANSPMHGSDVRVASGNLVVAKPIGVRDGVDFEHSGQVRRIDKDGIVNHLNDGFIVLLSPLGYSPTGEVFNLSHEDVAVEAAKVLHADKLIAFSEHKGLIDNEGTLLRNVSLTQMRELMSANALVNERNVLNALYHTVLNGTVRAHCVSYNTDGSLLKELFTRDGTGSLVTENHYEQLRPATINDVVGILQLIKPLEESGALVKRSRERLENEIEHFTVIERDGMIIACAALYPYADDACGELACVATHPDYRGKNRGERLLEDIVEQALKQGLQTLFVLTTLTAHWFLEQGFVPGSIVDLPQSKQELYNFTRNSKVFTLFVSKN
jgi:amino-acid N-acetyltransferase